MTGTKPADDCCVGEPAFGDPKGLHNVDCPVYLANMDVLERMRVEPGSRPVTAPDPAAVDPTLVLWLAGEVGRVVHGDRPVDVAERIAAALAEAGRLTPAGETETRTEWGVRLAWKDGHVDVHERENRASAEQMFAYHDSRARQQPDLWAVVPTLVCRTVVKAVGPWQPVPTEGGN